MSKRESELLWLFSTGGWGDVPVYGRSSIFTIPLLRFHVHAIDVTLMVACSTMFLLPSRSKANVPSQPPRLSIQRFPIR
jgi:hypothetical protein